MNTHIILRSPAASFATAAPDRIYSPDLIRQASVKELARRLRFKKIDHSDMPEIWNILKDAPGRTTDFSYGGLLMWVDFFNYEYAILNDTLFIKGRVESDLSKPAYSLPVGKMTLDHSVEILEAYCRMHQEPLEFSAVPEIALDSFKLLQPKSIEPLENWSDYLYSAEKLSTLSGKKLGKKRNHVNQFLAAYPDWTYEPLTSEAVDSVLAFMNEIDKDGDNTEMAREERNLNRKVLELIREGDEVMKGGILTDGHGRILAFTIGDIKGDTLFIHIEKALHSTPGGFEMINKTFAAKMKELHPEIEFINREDDAGDPGLRHAKQSYYPVEMLKKYNIIF